MKSLEYQLSCAAMCGCLKNVKNLVKKGVDVKYNLDVSVRLAAANNQIKVVKYLVKQGADATQALRMTGSFGHLKLAKWLVKQGADVNSVDTATIEQLKRHKCKGMVKLLKGF